MTSVMNRRAFISTVALSLLDFMADRLEAGRRHPTAAAASMRFLTGTGMMARMPPDVFGLTDDPLWYEDAIIYELHVRTFYDSDGDGVGDFPGLTQRLDYLQDLGVTALWLLPFCPSPLKDDGDHTPDYTGIHAAYGTMRDFKAFLREAH